MLAGSRWRKTGIVFTSSISTPLNERNVQREFLRIPEGGGLNRGRVGLDTLSVPGLFRGALQRHAQWFGVDRTERRLGDRRRTSLLKSRQVFAYPPSDTPRIALFERWDELFETLKRPMLTR